MLGRRRSLKRRLVAELVEDNVAQIRGLAPRRRRRPAAAGARWIAAVALPLSLLALSHGGSPVAPDAAAAAAGGGRPAAVRPAAGPPERRAAADLAPVDPAVFPLAVGKVVLDPGHGGVNGGTYIPSGLVEKDLTLDIGRRLRDLLTAAGYEVRMTRDDDRDVSLEERARFANREQADLFVSIHVNWIENRAVRGVETYYLGTTDDPFLTRLAAEENRGSGYAVADLRDLLEELYAGFRQTSSADAAAAVQRSLLRSLRTVNPAVDDRGVKTAPFLVLMKTDMPAVLAEVSCLSNRKEAELLARPLYRQYIAEALASGIESYAASRSPARDAGGAAGAKGNA